MKACRILAGVFAAALILHGAVDPVRVRAQIASGDVLVGAAGCGGDVTTAQVVVGDLNGDLAVDVVDLLIFVETFGKLQGEPGFNPEADFNCDTAIDVVDLLVFVDHFGT
jgi:hypothetical protein